LIFDQEALHAVKTSKKAEFVLIWLP